MNAVSTLEIRTINTASISLARMSPDAFRDFLAQSIETYAQENVVAGRWPAAGALARAQADFDSLLSNGADTPGQTVLSIRNGRDEAVGWLWYGSDDTHGVRQAHVYEIFIAAAHRRQGIATAAFRALEQRLRAEGYERVGLHVFGHNVAARALYVRLGFAVTSINMLKPLD